MASPFSPGALHFGFKTRLSRLQRLLASSGADALLLCASEGFDANTYYYSGDQTHPTFLLISKGSSAIFSLHEKDFSGLYEECFNLRQTRKKLPELIKQMRVRKLAIDDYSASAGAGLRLSQKHKLQPIALGEKLSELRIIKEPPEIECIGKASKITLQALAELESSGLAGKTENGAAGFLEHCARKAGSSLDAFPPMVLSGERACLFHNSTSNKKISPKDAVVVDCGARFNFYCADYTRTFCQKPSAKIKEAIDALEAAKSAAQRKARPGVTGRQLDQIALKVIEECGFGAFSHKVAGHGLGHFVGLNVHDGGRFYDTQLKPGMVFTIEPGIYVPGEFGARVEDTVVLD